MWHYPCTLSFRVIWYNLPLKLTENNFFIRFFFHAQIPVPESFLFVVAMEHFFLFCTPRNEKYLSPRLPKAWQFRYFCFVLGFVCFLLLLSFLVVVGLFFYGGGGVITTTNKVLMEKETAAKKTETP